MGWTLLLLLLKSDPASFKMKQDKHTQKRGDQNRGIENLFLVLTLTCNFSAGEIQALHTCLLETSQTYASSRLFRALLLAAFLVTGSRHCSTIYSLDWLSQTYKTESRMRERQTEKRIRWGGK